MTKIAMFTLMYWKPIFKGTVITVLSVLCIWIGTSAFKQNDKINRGDKAYDMSIKNTCSIDSLKGQNQSIWFFINTHCQLQEVQYKNINSNIDDLKTGQQTIIGILIKKK